MSVNIVYQTPGATMAALTEKALVAQLNVVEKERWKGIPARSGAIKTGHR